LSDCYLLFAYLCKKKSVHHMRKIAIALLAFPLIMAGCEKGSSSSCGFQDANIVAPASETAVLQAHITANSITATQHTSGMYYTIVQPGTGATASICSTIGIKYTGSFLNGTVFETSPSGGRQFLLGQLIAGWQKGIPLIKVGGRIRLYVPPSLAYGARDVRNELNVIVIPANSTLVFDIELLDVQ
jgi:FKBP-type peptidyl-prolyl cis-trans isomerase FkpA